MASDSTRVTTATVCFNRQADLACLVEALGDQTRKPERVLIVDNGSSPALSLPKSHLVTQLLRLPQNTMEAFNVALEEAAKWSDVIVQLDSDALPPRDLCERAATTLRSTGADLVACSVYSDRLRDDSAKSFRPWFSSKRSSVTREIRGREATLSGESPIHMPSEPNGTAATLAFNTTAFAVTADAVRITGGPDFRLGLYGREFEWWLRLRAAGLITLHSRDCVVLHTWGFSAQRRRVRGRSSARSHILTYWMHAPTQLFLFGAARELVKALLLAIAARDPWRIVGVIEGLWSVSAFRRRPLRAAVWREVLMLERRGRRD